MVLGYHLAAIICLLGTAIAWVFWSVRHHPSVDCGDGLGSVQIDLPHPAKLGRLILFFSAIAVYAVVVVAARGELRSLYTGVVLNLGQWVLPVPGAIAPYSNHLETGLRFMIAGAMLSLAVVIPATPGRRVAIALHAGLYLGMAVLLDCLVIVLSATTRFPVAYVGIEGIILNMILWSTVMLRVFFTTFVLPRPSQVPIVKRVYGVLTLQAVLIAITVLALLAMGTAVVITLGPLGHSLYIFLGFMTYALLWTIFILILRIFRAFQSDPSPATSLPDIHVIMCAYNESTGIRDTLDSIELAAREYPGRVLLTLADDGSEDATVEIVSDALAHFTAVSGEIINCSHGGKSRALNAALARVTGPIAVRIDADVVISANAFRCLPRWFEDPTVGNVGGSTFPRMAGSWVHRMRLIECLYGYLFVRPGLQAIDAIPCIPGTFQAFRPSPVRAVGGMVIGMNGEDADLTLQLGRLGYRAILDREIVIHEDVPTKLAEYREQRLRWYRSGAHLFARHGPFQGPSAGPRVWLSIVRAAIFRFMMMVRPVVYLYAAVWAIEQPSGSRNLWFVLVLFGSAVAPMLMCTAVIATKHGYARYLPWFLLWFPAYILVRRAIMIESLFTLPTRAVVVPWPGRARRRLPDFEPDATG